MISPSDTLGPYFDNEGEVLALGALNFLDPDTVSNKSVYLDQDLTTPASNPVILNSSGKLSNQIFYGVGDYLVRSYSLIDPDQVSPVFPDDYALVEQWIDKGLDATTSASNTSLWTVETIAELSDVDPNEHNVVQVIGYYDKEDDIDNRVYYWDSISVQAADGGAFIGSNVLGSGRWKLKCPSDDVDVRWFGAIPGSGLDCNGAINSAVAFAVSSRLVKGTSIYFPKGTYQVTAGTINVSCGVKIAQGVTFYNTNASDFILSIEQNFEIDKREAFNNGASVGNSILDFTSNNYGEDFAQLIDPRWYDDGTQCFTYAGDVPIIIRRTESVTIPVSISRNLVFRDDGLLDLTSGPNKLTVLSMDCIDNNQTRFSTDAGPTSTRLEFAGGVEVYSKWFNDNDDLKYVSIINSVLVMNNTVTLAGSYTLDLSKFDSIHADKGIIAFTGSNTLTLPGKLVGPILDLSNCGDNTSISISNGSFNTSNFLLNSGEQARQYIRLSHAQENYSNFNNQYFVTGGIDISGCGDDLRIYGLNLKGNLTASSIDSQTVSLSNCWVSGDTYTGTNTTLNLNDTTFKYTSIGSASIPFLTIKGGEFRTENYGLTCTDIELRNTVFKQRGGSVTTTNLTATDSTIRIGLDNSSNTETFTSFVGHVSRCDLNNYKHIASMNGLKDVELKFEDNFCRGTYVGPQGSVGYVNYLYITNNHFENTYGLSFYYPVTTNNFTPSGKAINRGILIADNTPSTTSMNLTADQTGTPNLASTGTRVAQTRISISSEVNIPLGGTNSFKGIVPTNPSYQNVLWLPSGLYEIGDNIGAASGNTLNFTQANFGVFDYADTPTSCWCNDWISNVNVDGTGSGDQYEGIACTWSGGSTGGGNNERVKVVVDLFKH